MRRIQTAMAGAGLLLGLTGLAEARSLYSPPVETLVTSDATVVHRLCCDILNTGSATASVTIHIRNRSAGAVMSFPSFSLASQEGTSRCLSGAVAAYCEFDIQGSPRSYRALAIYDAAGAYRVSVPAQ